MCPLIKIKIIRHFLLNAFYISNISVFSYHFFFMKGDNFIVQTINTSYQNIKSNSLKTLEIIIFKVNSIMNQLKTYIFDND